MNGVEKNHCIKSNTVLINSALMCRSRRSETLMYLQKKTDQKSQILKMLMNVSKTDLIQKSDTFLYQSTSGNRRKSCPPKSYQITFTETMVLQ